MVNSGENFKKKSMLNIDFIEYENRRYWLKQIIGKGAFATVYEVRSGESKYALKVINMEKLSKKSLQKLDTEISIHKNLTHKNIVKLFFAFERQIEKTNYTFLLLELCNAYTLNDLLKRAKNKFLSEQLVRRISLQIFDGLIYLRREKVIHRDIKLANILIKDLAIKIADFGLAAKLTERKMTICGTPNYIAPEILNKNEQSYEVDIWSVGILIYTLLVGSPPFNMSSPKEIYKKIRTGDLVFKREISPEAKDLLMRMLEKNPCERITIEEILAHPFFREKVSLLHNLQIKFKNNALNYAHNLNSDYVNFSIYLTEIRGIFFHLYSGVSGIYYADSLSIYFANGNILLYRSEIVDGKKKLYKENYTIFNLPTQYSARFEELKKYSRLFPNMEGRASVEFSFITRVKRIKNGYLFGLMNNLLVFDFSDGNLVVQGDSYFIRSKEPDQIYRRVEKILDDYVNREK